MNKEQIQKDLTQAQKDKDATKVDVLRMLLSEINNEEIRKRGEGKELTEEDVLAVIKRSIKKRKESIEMFEKANRLDLVEAEKKELKVLMQYMPAQMSEEQIEKIVDDVLQELGDNANFGQVMKEVMAKIKGQADGKLVSEVVKKKVG